MSKTPKHGVRIPLEGGAQIFIEADEPREPMKPRGLTKELEPVGAKRSKETTLQEQGEQVFEALKGFAKKCTDSISSLGPEAPQEVELEVGASLDAEGNLWIVKAKANASLKVRLKWVLPPETKLSPEADG